MEYRELVAAAKKRISEIQPEELDQLDDADVILIDVREPSEYEQGALVSAALVPRGTLEGAISRLVPTRDARIVLYCSVGARSALAAAALADMGYRRVESLAGGFEAWKRAGLPWQRPEPMSTGQMSRYARHIRLPEVGEGGQQRLLRSRVLIVGAGGLGSPAALYLAAAGVGTIGIVDDDHVDATNLQRQILHRLDRVGEAKVESARRTLEALNPDVKVEPYRERLSASNAVRIISNYDVVVDGADNFPTRYLINDASLHTKTPVVHGSIYRFEGQASVFLPYDGPCYRCLFPEPPPPHLAPSCEEGGVLGVLPGVIGSIQGTETIKVLLGIGTSIAGRLVTYDALGGEFAELRIQRDPQCPACGNADAPPAITDYDETCRPSPRPEP